LWEKEKSLLGNPIFVENNWVRRGCGLEVPSFGSSWWSPLDWRVSYSLLFVFLVLFSVAQERFANYPFYFLVFISSWEEVRISIFYELIISRY
jgi:hypothetical protein